MPTMSDPVINLKSPTKSTIMSTMSVATMILFFLSLPSIKSMCILN